MASFRASLIAEIRNNYSIRTICRKVNSLMLESLEPGNYVTAVYGVLEPHIGSLFYVYCGQHPPVLFHYNGSHEQSACQSPPLGIFENVSYRTEQMALEPGDLLVFFTDGVVEIGDQVDVDFGVERLARTIHAHQHLTAAELIDTIIQTTHQFSGKQSYLDDFTLVIVKRL